MEYIQLAWNPAFRRLSVWVYVFGSIIYFGEELIYIAGTAFYVGRIR